MNNVPQFTSCLCPYLKQKLLYVPEHFPFCTTWGTVQKYVYKGHYSPFPCTVPGNTARESTPPRSSWLERAVSRASMTSQSADRRKQTAEPATVGDLQPQAKTVFPSPWICPSFLLNITGWRVFLKISWRFTGGFAGPLNTRHPVL